MVVGRGVGRSAGIVRDSVTTVRHGQREPALDGIRALAVLAVVAFHAEAPGATGGFLGVDVFFVLSGFLITRLLLVEHAREGGIDLAGFWSRRLRRIVPALLVLIGGLVLIGLLIDLPAGPARSLPGDATAALLSVANWRFIATDQGYFGLTQAPSLLEHTWSLSIEEQFYLVWAPVLAFLGYRLARRRSPGGVPRRALLAVTLGGVALSAAWMAFRATRPDPGSTAYWDTLARLQGPLLGAALAIVLTGAATRRAGRAPRALATGLAVGGLAVLGALLVGLDASSSFLYPGGFLLAALAAAALIAGLHLDPAGPVARALGWGPVAALGVISFGVYLWHWPLIFLVTEERTGLRGLPLHGLRLALTLAAATVSFVLVERPIRRRPTPLGITAGALAVAGTSLVVALAVLAPPAPTDLVATDLVLPAADAYADPAASVLSRTVEGDRSSGNDPAGTVVAVPPATTATLPAPAPPTTVPATTVAPTVVPTVPPTPAPTTRPVPVGPPVRLSVFGDSLAQSLAAALGPQGATYGAVVRDDAIVGCGVLGVGPFRLAGTEYEESGICADWATTWEDRIVAERPEVALMVLGRHEVLDRVVQDEWRSIGDPVFDAALVGQLDLAIDIARRHGVPVVLTTAPYFAGRAAPGGGIRPENAPARVQRFNALVASRVGQDGVTVVDLGSMVSPNGAYASTIDGTPIRSDGVHFAASAGSWLAPRLLPQLTGVVR